MVEKRTRVVVYGTSLNMAGIAASLAADSSLDVMRLNPRSPSTRQSMNELDPTVIAFDLNDPDPGLDITLLRERPGLLLIGVDLSSNELMVLSGHAVQALSVADLVKVIHRQASTQESDSVSLKQLIELAERSQATETRQSGGESQGGGQ